MKKIDARAQRKTNDQFYRALHIQIKLIYEILYPETIEHFFSKIHYIRMLKTTQKKKFIQYISHKGPSPS